MIKMNLLVREGNNYFMYYLVGSKDISAQYWQGLYNGECELHIDTRKCGGTFECVKNQKMSYSEVKGFLNEKLKSFGVEII